MSHSHARDIANAIPEKAKDSLLGTPSHICGLPNRDLCVVDSQNHCLWILDRNGKLKYRIGTGVKGHKDGHLRDAEFNSPQSAVVFHSSLFVADTGNNLVREVSLTNAAVSSIHQSPAAPIDVYEFQEKLFIISSNSSSIHSYDPIRNQMGKTITGVFKQAAALTTNGDLLFFTELTNNSIKAWDGKNILNLFTPTSTEELHKPMGISYSGNNLYIADTYNHQVKVFSLATKKLQPLLGTGKAGNSCGDYAHVALKHPTKVFISGMSLFICDRGNNEIKVAELLLSKVNPFKVYR